MMTGMTAVDICAECVPFDHEGWHGTTVTEQAIYFGFQSDQITSCIGVAPSILHPAFWIQNGGWVVQMGDGGGVRRLALLGWCVEITEPHSKGTN
jgi:hypothetical protein